MSKFKGFMEAKMRDNNIDQSGYFACGIIALSEGNLEEAFLCFSEIKDSPAAFFNLALCYYNSTLYEKALQTLEDAEKLLTSKSPISNRTVPTPQEILKSDQESFSYKTPMSKYTPNLFPFQAKQRILRLKADIYGELGYEEEFIKLIPLFAGKNYKNIENIKVKFKQ